MYVQINIGRNIDNTPMTGERWQTFKDTVATLLLGTANGTPRVDNIETHEGTGHWEGVPEDSAHISLYHEPGFDINQLTSSLRTLKQAMGQDNIALITGSTLV